MRGKGFSSSGFTLVRSANVNHLGFTLVELLVAISILTILMTIAMVSFNNIQGGSRDAKRKSDISTIQSALEQYHADQGFYPTTITLESPLTNQIGLTPTPPVAKTYIQKVPRGAKTGVTEYFYFKKPDTCTNTVSNPVSYCTSYCLYATVENSSNAVNVANCGTVPPARSTYEVQAP